jgi:hypothetical protein
MVAVTVYRSHVSKIYVIGVLVLLDLLHHTFCPFDAGVSKETMASNHVRCEEQEQKEEEEDHS